jgi:hypothetical protein
MNNFLSRFQLLIQKETKWICGIILKQYCSNPKNMAQKKRSVLARTDNLMKRRDKKNPAKRQKQDHPVQRPGKENVSVSVFSTDMRIFILKLW